MAYVKCLMNVVSSTLPDGKTVTPTDDVSILLACAGRTETYTTISALLADATALAGVISSNNAIDYLVRSTTFASDVCADQGAMTDIGADNYASDTLLANSTWRTAICGSSYFESVLNVKVPVMTSNTKPSGYTASAKTEGAATRKAYCAFDGDNDTLYVSGYAGGGHEWLQIQFPNAVKIFFIRGFITEGTSQGIKYIVQYDNNGNWVDISETDTTVPGQVTTSKDFIISPITASSFRIYASQNTASNYRLVVNNLNYYGRADV